MSFRAVTYLDPFGGTDETVLGRSPATYHNGALGSDALLFHVPQDTGEFQEGRRARGRAHRTVAPRVAVVTRDHVAICHNRGTTLP